MMVVVMLRAGLTHRLTDADWLSCLGFVGPLAASSCTRPDGRL